MPGHQIRVWAQTYTFLPRHDCDHPIISYNMSGHKCVWAQTCVGTIVSGHKCVWAQTCLVTNVCEHKRVWAQTCMGTNVSGHKRVWAQSCGLKYVWAQTCGLQCVVLPQSASRYLAYRPFFSNRKCGSYYLGRIA